jgi:hypothetical protein
MMDVLKKGTGLFVLILTVSNAYADRCATPLEVKDRLISPDYEWSVNEEVTLDGLLSVSQLYGVTIENYGEFVACKYEASQQYIRLDGAPKDSKCPVRPISDNWFISESGRMVCDEKDNTLCHFESACS